MKVEDLMRTEFITLQADDSLSHVVKTLVKNGINSAPVVERGEFIGVVGDVELVRYFTPKKFIFLWKKNKETPMEELMKVTAGKIAGKPGISLKPNQDISGVLEKIALKSDCVPVLDRGKLVGLIRGTDIIEFFLKEFAKHESKVVPGVDAEARGTEVDRLFEFVEKKGAVSVQNVAKELGLPTKTVEALGEVLQKNHLLEMKYSFLGGATLRVVRDGKR